MSKPQTEPTLLNSLALPHAITEINPSSGPSDVLSQAVETEEITYEPVPLERGLQSRFAITFEDAASPLLFPPVRMNWHER